MRPESLLKGKTILIVDDEPDLRQCLVFEFKRAGCTVLQAESGRQAFELFSNHNTIDAILSDVRMPDGDGIELLEKLRALHPAIPVVLLITGFADINEAQAKSKGANGLLEKPIDRKLMVHTMEQLIMKSLPTAA